jgi:gamma-glutamylcyclotransferase (GGCT)/AIG2-like uncharacterized protein YtfP
LRSRGEWTGNIVVITIDFKLPENFKRFYNIEEVTFPEITSKHEVLTKVKGKFSNSDGREITKINQWEKFHVFDKYFKKWRRVLFFDAGLRILDSIKYLLNLDYTNSILAPNDAGHNNKPDKIFSSQISFHDPDLIDALISEFGADILNKHYFLNCIWIYDTNILEYISKEELIDVMIKYPCCITNEMTIMNLVFNFKHNVWKEFPYFTKYGKYLFDWCELNNPGTNWTQYCYMKYPVTISFDDC